MVSMKNLLQWINRWSIPPIIMEQKKNVHAQALGRLGGLAGRGHVKARTSEQARAAVMVRWPEWIGSRPDVACKQFKKDLVLQPWQSPIRIAFRFETVWCVREGNNLLLSNGELLPFTRVITNGKCLVGLNDPYQTGLDYSEDSKAFRNALQQRMSDGCTHDSLKEKDGCQVCAICGTVLIP